MIKTSRFSLPLAIACLLLLIGFLARIQHWAHGVTIQQIAFVSIAVLYSARYAMKSTKYLSDFVKTLVIVGWSIGVF